jgi:hypothetical protein
MVSSILPESSGTEDSEWHRDTACERNDKEVKAQQAHKIRELGDALVLRGIPHTRPASQGAWVLSKHGLDHTQG